MTLGFNLKFIKWYSCAKLQLNMPKHIDEKCGKLCIPSSLISKRGITPTKIDNTFELDLMSIEWKSYANFKLNIPKHVWEKCRKLCIFSILSSKRGITPAKIEAKGRHSNLICSKYSIKKSYAKFHFNMSKHVGESAENC